MCDNRGHISLTKTWTINSGLCDKTWKFLEHCNQVPDFYTKAQERIFDTFYKKTVFASVLLSREKMMAMVEESAIEMGSTGNVGAVSLNSPTSIIMTDNMPEEEIVETEEERWIVRGRVTLIWTIFESTVLTGWMTPQLPAYLACSIPSFLWRPSSRRPKNNGQGASARRQKFACYVNLIFPSRAVHKNTHR